MMSFVNGLHTWAGGAHENHVIRQLAKAVASARKMPEAVDELVRELPRNMIVVFHCVLKKPIFTNQTKERLATPAKDIPEWKPPESFIKKVC